VAESVGVGTRFGLADHDLAGQRFAERDLELGFGQPGDRGEQVGRHPPPGDGGDTQDALCFLGQRRHPAQEHVPQCLGDPIRVRLGARRQELLHEEGVALAAPCDRVDEPGGRNMVEDGRHQRIELVAPLARPLEALDPGQPVRLGQPRAEWMAPMELVGPIGPDHEQSFGAGIPRQERGDVPSRSIVPMEILEDQGDRSPLAERSEQRQQTLEDARLDPFGAVQGGRVGRPEPSSEPACPARWWRTTGDRRSSPVWAVGQGRREIAKSLDDRRERQAPAVAQGHAAALQDDTPACLARPDLGNKPGLADPGIAADQTVEAVPPAAASSARPSVSSPPAGR
jgi:hypothetical protein